MPAAPERPAAPGWIRPASEQGGLTYYLEVVRERIWIVVGAVLLALAVAAIYLLLADEVYEGEAKLLVTPVSADDPLVAQLPLIRESSDPTRDVETVSELVTELPVAERAAKILDTGRSPSSLLGDVTAAPVGPSSVVAVTAEGSSPEEAANLANAFADGFVKERTLALHRDVDRRIEQLQTEQASGTGIVPDESINGELSRLTSYLAGPDPTVRVEAEAQPRLGPVSPRPTLTLGAATLGGLVLGLAAAFAVQTVDPRLRREEQLRSRYNLPILARIPRDSHRRPGIPLVPGAVSPATRESYRTLRANIAAAGRGSSSSQSILVTGSAPAEGKTSTALNLAASFALAGNRVILIEADLRRPSIGDALGVEAGKGIVSTLLEDVSLDDALVGGTPFGPNLRLLLTEYRGGWMSELFSLGAAHHLVDEAKALADYVIIDSPPLTAVVDTLPLARQADHLVVVARLGVTRLDRLRELGELLGSNDIRPLGFALVGTPHPDAGSYYYAGMMQEPPRAREVPAMREAPRPVARRRRAERTG